MAVQISQVLLVLTLITGFSSTVGLSSHAKAQSVHLRSSYSWQISLGFKPPARGGPTATAGGASRSFCVTGKTPLTILTPTSNLGLTTDSHPTVFLYIPKTAAKSAEFVLKDGDDNDVYRATVQLDKAPGVMSLSLPKTAPALQPNKDYRWYFSMICRPGDRLEDVFVSSWLQRVQPDQTLTQALQKASPRQIPTVYSEAGIWYDTLKSLAELRHSNPNDVALVQDWSTLLQSVGLGQVSDAPLLMPTVLMP